MEQFITTLAYEKYEKIFRKIREPYENDDHEVPDYAGTVERCLEEASLFFKEDLSKDYNPLVKQAAQQAFQDVFGHNPTYTVVPENVISNEEALKKLTTKKIIKISEQEFLTKLDEKIKNTGLFKKIAVAILGFFLALFATSFSFGKFLDAHTKPSVLKLVILLVLSFLFAAENFIFFFRAFVTSRALAKVEDETGLETFLLISACIGIFFMNITIPINIYPAILTVISPFVFPIIETLMRQKASPFHEKLTLRQLILRSQIVIGLEIGFVLLMFMTAAFINILFLIAFTKDQVLKIFWPISLFLSIPVVFFMSFKKRMPLFKAFFKKRVNFILFITGIIFLYAQIIVNLFYRSAAPFFNKF